MPTENEYMNSCDDQVSLLMRLLARADSMMMKHLNAYDVISIFDQNFTSLLNFFNSKPLRSVGAVIKR